MPGAAQHVRYNRAGGSGRHGPSSFLGSGIGRCLAGDDNQHHPHRARNLRPPDVDDIGTVPVTHLAARMRCRKILGGLIHEYGQAA